MKTGNRIKQLVLASQAYKFQVAMSKSMPFSPSENQTETVQDFSL